MAGAALRSTLGKLVDGQKLLLLFAFVMAAVGIALLRPRASGGDPGVRINPAIAVRLLGLGFLGGAISGFFGIGGGFLVVPGIMLGSGMPILKAIGLLGIRLATRLAVRRHLLVSIFAGAIFVVAIYMALRTTIALHGRNS